MNDHDAIAWLRSEEGVRWSLGQGRGDRGEFSLIRPWWCGKGGLLRPGSDPCGRGPVKAGSDETGAVS